MEIDFFDNSTVLLNVMQHLFWSYFLIRYDPESKIEKQCLRKNHRRSECRYALPRHALKSFGKMHHRTHPPVDDILTHWYLQRWVSLLEHRREAYSPYFACSITCSISLWSFMGRAANVSSVIFLSRLLRRALNRLRPSSRISSSSSRLVGSVRANRVGISMLYLERPQITIFRWQ